MGALGGGSGAGGAGDRDSVGPASGTGAWPLPVLPHSPVRGVFPALKTGSHHGGPRSWATGRARRPPGWPRRVMLTLAPAWISPRGLMRLGPESGIKGAWSNE